MFLKQIKRVVLSLSLLHFCRFGSLHFVIFHTFTEKYPQIFVKIIIVQPSVAWVCTSNYLTSNSQVRLEYLLNLNLGPSLHICYNCKKRHANSWKSQY